MITVLAHQIQTHISRRNELEQRHDNRKNIAETYQRLREVEVLLRQTITSFNLIKSRLPDEHVEEAVKRLKEISNKVDSSREKFATEYRQIRELNNIESLVNALKDFLAQAWASYVLTQTHAPLELLKLVETLPEVKVQINTISSIQESLLAASNTLPRRESTLVRFDTDLQSLTNSLANLSGLAPEVTGFLRKVQRGTASIADLTDEILLWCREKDRATAFNISFGQTR
jgi:hypothetical protein